MDTINDLFGGPIPDPLSMLYALTTRKGSEGPLPPETMLLMPPIGDFPTEDRYELFELCYQRFDHLRTIGLALSGLPGLRPRRRPQDVPALLAGQFAGPLSSVVNLLKSPHASFAGRPPTREEFDAAVPAELLQETWSGLTAAPFFLEPEMAHAVLRSEPPGAEILGDLRLPVPRVAIIFGAPVAVSTESGWWSAEDADAAVERDHVARELSHRIGLSQLLRGNSARTNFLLHGGYVNGIVLTAGSGGRLEDHVVWLLGYRDEEGADCFFNVSGHITASALAPVVQNLAATVCWAPWTEPDDEISADDLQRFVRSKEFRRISRSPARLGVRIVGACKSRSTVSHGESDRSPAPHLRRGHWRSVRVAARDQAGTIVGSVAGVHGTDWHYEGRWIAPTFVNAAGGGTSCTQVFTMPEKSLFQGGRGGDNTADTGDVGAGLELLQKSSHGWRPETAEETAA